MKVAEAIAQALVAEGVRLAAGITGQSVGHVADALAEKESVKVVYVRQERVAIDIADGFARASGAPAVVFADAGPAAANAMGGLVNSWGDSVPVLFIAGHNDKRELPSGDSKEIPFREIFGPVTKWCSVIERPDQVVPILRRAFMHLTSGRPGPVVVGMPYDVSSMEVEAFEYKPVSASRRVRAAGDPAAIEEAVDLLAFAERPYVYVGAGSLYSGAAAELVELAELLTLPVATTLNGKSAFPEDHPLALGVGGFAQAAYGSLPASKLARDADVILTIGCGFKRHATQKPRAKGSKHIQIDVDAGELNKHHVADVAILGDARLAVRQIIEAARRRLSSQRLEPVTERIAHIARLQDEWLAVSRPLTHSDESPVNPFRVTRELDLLLGGRNSILLHDAGSVRGSTCQHYIAREPGAFIGFGVQSAMGWSIGAAIGAKICSPEKVVATVIGEEAIAETMMDIETSIRANAPILIVVKNNRAFADRDGGSSQKLAHARFNGGVDACAVAAALGASVFTVRDPAQLADALRAARDSVQSGRTALVEVFTKRVKARLSHLWE
jgi:thiamine pyrophosphate-dependent acetolactate synthase large subunit-like protein